MSFKKLFCFENVFILLKRNFMEDYMCLAQIF